MTLDKAPDPSAAARYHCIVPFGDLALADRKRLFEFFWERAKGWFEKQGIIKLVAYTPIECNEHCLSQLEAGEHLLVPNYLSPIAALISTVKEPSF